MHDKSIRWAPAPVVPVEPVNIPIQVSGQDRVRLWILSDQVTGVMVHYDGQRTLPCTEATDQSGEVHACWHPHTHPDQTRWQGWLAVCRVGFQETRIVCITPSVFAQNRMLATRVDLRGLRLDLWRNAPRPTARMMGAVMIEQRIPPLGKAPDLRPLLAKMWDAPLHRVPLTKRQSVEELVQELNDHRIVPTGD